MNEPIWITEARKHICTTEIKGPENNPEILQWWKDIKRGTEYKAKPCTQGLAL